MGNLKYDPFWSGTGASMISGGNVWFIFFRKIFLISWVSNIFPTEKHFLQEFEGPQAQQSDMGIMNRPTFIAY